MLKNFSLQLISSHFEAQKGGSVQLIFASREKKLRQCQGQIFGPRGFGVAWTRKSPAHALCNINKTIEKISTYKELTKDGAILWKSTSLFNSWKYSKEELLLRLIKNKFEAAKNINRDTEDSIEFVLAITTHL